MHLNPTYVQKPFHELIGQCENNVLLGLRLIDKIEKFPDTTPEEQKFIMLSAGRINQNLTTNKEVFKKWVIKNGFEDIHKSIRITLERLFVFKELEKILDDKNINSIKDIERNLIETATKYNFPNLLKNVNSLLETPLSYQQHIESFNNARNCFVHTNGIVTGRHCNNTEKNILTIHGNRFKLFFDKNGEEFPAEIGKAGPENAALKMGAEFFKLEFPIDAEIILTLKDFIDIINTIIFIQADLDVKLKKN